jgi:hypothetical protein
VPPGTHAPAAPKQIDAWPVVSAYYFAVESHNYRVAWGLLSSDARQGQTYQQFVARFACTGSQVASESGESGDQVQFTLYSTNSCSGQVLPYTGTATVQNGHIVAAHLVKTS